MSFTSNELVDVWVLVDSISNSQVASKMNDYTTSNPSSGIPKLLKKKNPLTTEKKQAPLFWEEIKEGVTGYARIVHFVNHSHVYNQVEDYDNVFGDNMVFRNQDDSSLEVKLIEEGKFEKGVKNGYARVITPSQDAACQLGFFVDGAPKGKHVFYKQDGTFSKPEGLYDGEQVSTKITIANYMQKISRN